MTERQIINRIKKLKELEAQQAALADQIDVLKAEIKDHMGDREEIVAGNYIVHWSHVVANKLDVTRIKKELPDLYGQYIKETRSRRFSISTI